MLHNCVLNLVAVLAISSFAFAEDKPTQLFTGKDLSGWKLKGDNSEKSHWIAAMGSPMLAEADAKEFSGKFATDSACLVNTQAKGVDVYSEAMFGDCIIEIEFMIPKGSNSGIYVMGEYEVQIFDSYGKEKLGMGDLGALYSAAAPKINAAKQPGEWQSFRIEFQAPKFDGDKKIQNAKFVSVKLNGKLLHENIEMKGPTPGGLTGKEAATGPIMFQGDHGPVAYRNITILPKK